MQPSPDYWVVKINESDSASEHLRELCGGKVYGIYLVDLTEATRLCEIRMSYLLKHIEHIAEEYPEHEDDKAFLDEVLEGDVYDKVLADALEEYRANPHF